MDKELNTLDLSNEHPLTVEMNRQKMALAQQKLEAEKKKELEKLTNERRKQNILIRNQLLIEDGTINYTVGNRFGIRLVNHRKFGPGAIGSLETYIQNMQLQNQVNGYHETQRIKGE